MHFQLSPELPIYRIQWINSIANKEIWKVYFIGLKIKVNDIVHVPSLKAGMPESYPSEMVNGKIVDIEGKNLKYPCPMGIYL